MLVLVCVVMETGLYEMFTVPVGRMDDVMSGGAVTLGLADDSTVIARGKSNNSHKSFSKSVLFVSACVFVDW